MSIFNSANYKTFLKTELKKRPKAGRGELARLASYLNVNATLVSQIFSGEKDLNLEQAQVVCSFLSLNKIESDYFMLLVQIERAGTEDLKKYFREKRDELKKDSLQLSKRVLAKEKLSDLDRSIFYSSGLYSAIHLFTSIGKGQTLENILNKFDVDRVRALDILQFLVNSGLCVAEKGFYKMGTQSTHVEKGSPFMIKHHTNWRVAAIQKSEKITDEEMMFTANISLSKKDLAKIREVLAKTIQEIAKTVNDSPAEDIANLNIDLFWLN